MIDLRRMLAITSTLPLVVFLNPASSASAATSLYHGSIRIILSYGASSTYSIPFGANISYPHMDNLPAGDIATVSGSAPAAIGLGANQITLRTSLGAVARHPCESLWCQLQGNPQALRWYAGAARQPPGPLGWRVEFLLSLLLGFQHWARH